MDTPKEMVNPTGSRRRIFYYDTEPADPWMDLPLSDEEASGMTQIENEDGYLFYYGEQYLGDASNLKILSDDERKDEETGNHD